MTLWYNSAEGKDTSVQVMDDKEHSHIQHYGAVYREAFI